MKNKSLRSLTALCAALVLVGGFSVTAVSYTHLDVYKRQAMQRYLKEHQRDFMPEDTKAGMIQAYLDKYTGSMVCSKQLYKEALKDVYKRQPYR